MPQASDFRVASCQATLFTPEADVSSARFMARILPSWADRFDGDPLTFPLPEGVPKEVPKMVLQSRTQEWRCEIASGRINLFWRRPSQDGSEISLVEFYRTVVPLLIQYRGFVDSPVRRVAAVVNRYRLQDTPGRYLAQHFCRDRWLTAPLNRPENFELHAHKVFKLTPRFAVNSWVRNKTGKLAGVDRSIVVVEQDLNTLTEEMHDFSEQDIQSFFDAALTEFDTILQLYYPADIE
jgi:hypothetical protein